MEEINKNRPELGQTQRRGYIELKTIKPALNTATLDTATAQDITLNAETGFLHIVVEGGTVLVRSQAGASASDWDLALAEGPNDLMIGKDVTVVSFFSADGATVYLAEHQ